MIPGHFSSKLSFFIAEKNSYLVVSLIGTLSEDQLPVLQECEKQIQQSPAKWIVINFRDIVPEKMKSPLSAQIGDIMLRGLQHLQSQIRAKPAILRLSSLHPAIKKTLLDCEVVHPEELTNNLMDALGALLTLEEGGIHPARRD